MKGAERKKLRERERREQRKEERRERMLCEGPYNHHRLSVFGRRKVFEPSMNERNLKKN